MGMSQSEIRTMKRQNSWALCLLLVTLTCVSSWNTRAAEAPKRILLVTVTYGFPHSSIPTAEKVLTQLGQKSGAFTIVDIVNSGPRPKDKAEETQREQKNKSALAEKMSREALKKYDAFIFANTTGILPLPDKDAFLAEIRNGKAFVGMHSASDTFRGPENTVDPYIEMLGGEFLAHGAQVGVECIVQDAQHPATKPLAEAYCIEKEEIYLFKNYNTSRVHELLVLDKHPSNKKQYGHFPVAWCRNYGQ